MPELPTPQPQPDAAARPDDRLDDGARLTLKLRRNLAALSLVGAALVALPLVQLLRYQSAELEAMAAGRAKLDPVARAVQVQRGLLAHRDISARVLGGLFALEPERQQRQNEVQGRLVAMGVTLAEGHWELAIGEADELHQDWLQLVQQVAARSIDPAGSDRAHRLLVEQTLQVIDLVGSAVQAEASSGIPAATLAAVHALPRLIWQTSLLAQPADPTTASLDDVESQLARTLGHLEGAPAQGQRPPRVASAKDPSGPSGASDSSGPAGVQALDIALLQAVAGAGARSERYFSLLRGPADPAQRQAARQAAVQAQIRLFDLAQGRAVTQLASHSRAVSQRRALLLGGMTALALLALALLAGLWRGLLHRHSPRPAPGTGRQAPRVAELAAGDAPERRAQSDGLMQRLRQAARRKPAAVPADAGERVRSDIDD